MITPNGILEIDATGRTQIVAPGSITWSTVPATWSEWENYNATPATELYWLSQIADTTKSDYYTLTTAIDADGDVEYFVYGSNTGAFAGEETETVLARDGSSVEYGFPAFVGRWFRIGIKVMGERPVIRSFNFSLSSQTSTVYLNSINSNQLIGSSSSRSVYIGQTAHVFNIQLTGHATEPYVSTGYVADDYFEEPASLTPGIRDKGQQPSIYFHSGGISSDTVFDGQFVCLPEMYWNDQNIQVRTPNPLDGRQPTLEL